MSDDGININVEDLTLGEMDDFERESGMLASDLQAKPLTAKAISA